MSAKSRYECTLVEFPGDWDTVPITQLGKIISGSTPSRDVPAYWGGEIPWVTPGELTALDSKVIANTNECITPQGLTGCGANLLPAGSLLITTRATLGERAINSVPMATNQGFKTIVFRIPSDSHYYYYWTEKLKAELVRRASGTTFLEISGSQFSQISVPYPPESERVKIAQILDTLDTQIRQTEALIAKLERIKQGLLTDLLTRGIDENGQLRPPPEEAPHLYKDSPLGQIPREWTVEKLGTLIKSHNAGIYIPKDQYGRGVPILGVSDLYAIEVLEDQPLRMAPLSPSDKPPYTLKEGDIVYGESSLVLDGIARTVAVGEGGEGKAFEWHTRRLTIDRAIADSYFLSSQLNYFSPVRRKIMSVATQTALTGMTTEGFFSVDVNVPTLEEQRTIFARLKSVNERISAEGLALRKARQEKIALMDDLLTGRVRVTPLLDTAKEAYG